MAKVCVTCPNCGKIYNLNENLVGKKANCKHCSQVFTITRPVHFDNDNATAFSEEDYSFMNQPQPVAEETVPTKSSYHHLLEEAEKEKAVRVRPTVSTIVMTMLVMMLMIVLSQVLAVVIGFPIGHWIGSFKYNVGSDNVLAWLLFSVARVTGLVGLIAMFVTMIKLLMMVFWDDLIQGLLTLFVPFYLYYYVALRWKDYQRAFYFYMASCVLCMFGLSIQIGIIQ